MYSAIFYRLKKMKKACLCAKVPGSDMWSMTQFIAGSTPEFFVWNTALRHASNGNPMSAKLLTVASSITTSEAQTQC